MGTLLEKQQIIKMGYETESSLKIPVEYTQLHSGEVMGMPLRSGFSDGLCDCHTDCGTCCYGTWCGPCLFGENFKKMALLSGVPAEEAGCCNPCCNYYCSAFLPALTVSSVAFATLSMFPAWAA